MKKLLRYMFGMSKSDTIDFFKTALNIELANTRDWRARAFEAAREKRKLHDENVILKAENERLKSALDILVKVEDGDYVQNHQGNG